MSIVVRCRMMQAGRWWCRPDKHKAARRQVCCIKAWHGSFSRVARPAATPNILRALSNFSFALKTSRTAFLVHLTIIRGRRASATAQRGKLSISGRKPRFWCAKIDLHVSAGACRLQTPTPFAEAVESKTSQAPRSTALPSAGVLSSNQQSAPPARQASPIDHFCRKSQPVDTARQRTHRSSIMFLRSKKHTQALRCR